MGKNQGTGASISLEIAEITPSEAMAVLTALLREMESESESTRSDLDGDGLAETIACGGYDYEAAETARLCIEKGVDPWAICALIESRLRRLVRLWNSPTIKLFAGSRIGLISLLRDGSMDCNAKTSEGLDLEVFEGLSDLGNDLIASVRAGLEFAWWAHRTNIGVAERAFVDVLTLIRKCAVRLGPDEAADITLELRALGNVRAPFLGSEVVAVARLLSDGMGSIGGPGDGWTVENLTALVRSRGYALAAASTAHRAMLVNCAPWKLVRLLEQRLMSELGRSDQHADEHGAMEAIKAFGVARLLQSETAVQVHDGNADGFLDCIYDMLGMDDALAKAAAGVLVLAVETRRAEQHASVSAASATRLVAQSLYLFGGAVEVEKLMSSIEQLVLDDAPVAAATVSSVAIPANDAPVRAIAKKEKRHAA